MRGNQPINILYVDNIIYSHTQNQPSLFADPVFANSCTHYNLFVTQITAHSHSQRSCRIFELPDLHVPNSVQMRHCSAFCSISHAVNKYVFCCIFSAIFHIFWCVLLLVFLFKMALSVMLICCLMFLSTT